MRSLLAFFGGMKTHVIKDIPNYLQANAFSKFGGGSDMWGMQSVNDNGSKDGLKMPISR